jgi:hypothetical protein
MQRRKYYKICVRQWVMVVTAIGTDRPPIAHPDPFGRTTDRDMDVKLDADC